MHHSDAPSRAFIQDQRRGDAAARRRLLTAALATALLVAPASVAVGIATDAAPAAASELSIPLADGVQTRMATHTGWDGSVAANPDQGDCVRYGSAPDAVTTGTIDNPGGTAGTDAAAWSDGATAWVAAGDTAYSAHGRGGASCSTQLDLSAQSAVGFSPASISQVETGVAFNLGRMVHRNNPIYATNSWFRGAMDVRLLGLDLSYAWQLHETPNEVSPPEDPANNDVLEFVSTVTEQSFVGADGNRYTLVVRGFAAPLADGTCAPTLTDPGEADNRFETVERTSTYGCLYGQIQQVRSLTVVKVAAAAHSAPDTIPAFGFTTAAAMPGSAWQDGFALTPSAVGTAGAASVTRDIVVGETLTIQEDAVSAPWSLTSLACVDGTGAALPITSGGQITIAGDLSASDAAAAPITCTYTNTFDPRGSLALTKTVTPRDGTPVEGFTAAPDRSFDLAYTCVIDGVTVAEGVATVTTTAPATVTGIPVGADCAIAGEDVEDRAGDFADGSYRWDGFDVSAGSVVVSADATATLAVDNRFVRVDTPAPPVTPPTQPVDPAPPATPDSPTGPLAMTGAGSVVPIGIVGAALLGAGALAVLLVRRRKTQG